MKRLVLILFLFSSLQCWCQHFEGLIKYTATSYVGSVQISYITVIIKNKNFHIVGTDNVGNVQTEIYLNGDLDMMYMVLTQDKTVYQMKISELQKKYPPPNTEKIIELDDTLNVMGYSCKHYRLKSDDKVEDVWMAPKMSVMDIGYNGKWTFHGIPGMLMKSDVVYTNNQRTSMEMTYFEPMTVDIRDFELPQGFKIVDGTPFGN